jgi:predicted ribosome quality control (RQC) complex YloA/Tae2 family protein
VCRELAYRAYGNIQPLMEDVKSFDGGMALIVELCDLKTMILDGDFRPTLLTTPDGRPKDFSFMEITQYDGVLTSKRVSGFSQLLDMFYTKRDIANRMRDKAQSLIKTVRTARDRTARRLANQTKELKATENREEYRQNGDIIMANLHLIKRGDTVLDAYDFYSEDGSNRKIRLDPAKTPHQNASKYYKDYTKAKNARVILTEQTENGKIELDYLDSVLESLLRVEREQDLEEIRQELVRTGYVKQSKDAKRKPVKQAKPMEFVSSAGFSILVGRNNSQNDELVRSSFKNDIWLHTLKIHGSTL